MQQMSHIAAPASPQGISAAPPRCSAIVMPADMAGIPATPIGRALAMLVLSTAKAINAIRAAIRLKRDLYIKTNNKIARLDQSGKRA